MSNTDTKKYDIVIVGGGLVGASMAAALSGRGLRIAVVEAVPMRAVSQPSFDDRTLAINLASRRILEQIQLWPGSREGVTPIKKIHVSQKGRTGITRMQASEHGLDALGHVVEARLLGERVKALLPSLKDVSWISPAKLQAFRNTDTTVALDIETEAGDVTIEAQMMVGADGTASPIRERLCLPTREIDYGQVAVIANVVPERSHHNVAYERLTSTGPVAMLPHVGQRCGSVWCMQADDLDEVMGLSDEQFLARLQQRFGYRLGKLRSVGRRASYPLKMVHAPESIGERTVIIGNAAHTVHPVAAQGFNLGLRDVAMLAEKVLMAKADGQDFGSREVLTDYQSSRQKDQQETVNFTDALVRGFAPSGFGLGHVRGLAMLGLDLSKRGRNELVRRRLGLTEPASRLARGLSL